MGENGIAFQKGCLMVILQVVIMVLAFTVIGVNQQFEEAIKPELKCMNISQSHKLCLSVFERNHSLIPHNKGFSANSIRLNRFKFLEFEQDATRLRNQYENSIQQYFQLINYDKPIQSIDQLSLDTSILAITEMITDQEGSFHEKAVKSVNIHPDTEVVVFYFILQNTGPVIASPEIKIVFPNRNSIDFNNKFCIIECFLAVLVLICWTVYRYSINKSPQVVSFWQLNQLSKVNRIIQFLFNFAMNNVIYLLTVNKFWQMYGLNFINQVLAFETKMVPMFQANSYDNFVNLFPEWLLFSYFIFLVLERYVNWKGFKMVLITGFLGAIMPAIPFIWPQFIFQASIILIGIILSMSIKSNSNNKLTVSLVFVAVTLILMILIKMKWVYSESQDSDFMLRFFYNQLFVLNNLLSFFFVQQQISAQQKKSYIPYEEYSMEEQHQFQESDMVPHAQKMGSQQKF